MGLTLWVFQGIGIADHPDAATSSDAGTEYHFERKVANIEITRAEFRPASPEVPIRVPHLSGDLWYGEIPRRLEGDGPFDNGNYVTFLAEYVQGVPSRAVYDSDFDLDLTDEEVLQLSEYPPIEGSRSFIARLGWTSAVAGPPVTVEKTVRVVLERPPDPATRPVYHVQDVHAMVGSVTVDGVPRRAFLYDGNADGFYTKGFADGIFIDSDGDGHFNVDLMSPEFGPFAVPFRMGNSAFEVTSIDRLGNSLTIREVGEDLAGGPVQVGKAVPDFAYRDLSGREIHLRDLRGRPVVLYFWASWCSTCVRQAPNVTEFLSGQPVPLTFLGVSLDFNESAMKAFRQKNSFKWPTTFTGHHVWEDPLGRLFSVRATGTFCLIDPEGRFVGSYRTVDDLQNQLRAMKPPPPGPATALRSGN